MAFLIPENTASRSDIPATLQAVAKAFRDVLPEDVTVWLDREGDASDGEPYLTVLDPTIGIALVYAPKITKRDTSGGLFGRRKVGTDIPKAVLARARTIEGRLGAENRLPDSLPAAALVAAPTLDARGLERLGLERETTLCEEDFLKEALRPAIARALSVDPERPLTELQERVVRGVLKPEIVISGASDDEVDGSQLIFRPPEGDEDAIRVLDRQQERLAHHLGEGYRVIRGVAGSGKTLVLTFRAKWFAVNFPNREVLLTCFNVPLQKALEAELKDSPSVTVRTIDALAYDANRRSVKGDGGAWTQARLDAAAKLRSAGGRFDVVLVDEAQDLDVAGLDLAFAALRRNREDFVIALDGAQNVYRKSARWNPPDQTARGRSTIMRVNYRNTKEILELAHRFLGGGNEMPSEAALDDPTVIVPPEASSRRGPKPKVLLCRDATDEVGTILDAVTAAHKAGVAWREMAILYGNARPYQYKLYSDSAERAIPYFWVSMGAKTKRQVIEAGDVVRCATFQGLKGLEFSHVFMCGVNDIFDWGGTDADTIRRITYVAMTRAMDELTITVSGDGPVGTAIQAASR